MDSVTFLILIILLIPVIFALWFRDYLGKKPNLRDFLFRSVGPRADIKNMSTNEIFYSGLLHFSICLVFYGILILSRIYWFSFVSNSGILLTISFYALFLFPLYLIGGLVLLVNGIVLIIINSRRKSIDKSWYIKPADIAEHVSCGGVVARIENGRILIALLREDDFRDHVLPKGHLEKGETLEQAAIREIAEESGLTYLTLVRELGVRERLDLKKTSWKKTHYFLFRTLQISGTINDTYHTYVLEWFPLDNMPRMFWPEQQELVESNRASIKQALSNL